ncbi:MULTISPECIES: hypothetical protein [Pseudomonas]|uniref:Zinc-ribbon domain-containing protein n=1 Tax=Pseudomonas aeruginosa TaxID=287 RepID=A0AAQ3LIS7_PSEAI|nr:MULTISPECIES: hypothetical protein [Pseudomonas]EIU4789698.1 hypothetical protein [Pseudomonas aeruginosa]EKP5710333.1 hypothetical protein [Pseudomonas aeruginosa]EKV8092704.1 hypothetical protein [Pseudomonas aeruginosa]EKW4466630.1 hypothetical protein [Pseudomonas aeruginosa]EKW6389335.1 hypothetical protein [Pseudomonas aeruginosa]
METLKPSQNVGDIPYDSPVERSGKLRQLLTLHDLRCLDSEWKGWPFKYQFRCREGHVFSSRISSLSRGCPACAAQAHDQRLFDIARAAGVTCLEKRWLGAKASHRFRCSMGHHWVRTGKDLLQRSECPNAIFSPSNATD